MVPLTVPLACTCTGEMTVEPLAGVQMWTPGDDGALQDPPPPDHRIDRALPLLARRIAGDNGEPMGTGSQANRSTECIAGRGVLLHPIHPQLHAREGSGDGCSRLDLDRRADGRTAGRQTDVDTDGRRCAAG